MSVKALYIHVPFCKRRCLYCDFASSVCKYGDARMYAYIQKIIGYLGEFANIGLFDRSITGYVGGGTPTMLGSELLEQLLVAMHQCAAFSELTFEANPDSLDQATLKHAKAAGATRVSVGVQSFIPGELEALGRVHSAGASEHALKAAAKSGLSVSCDLMCGIPYQSFDSWRFSLEKFVSLGLSHVSIYPLMIEEGTALEKMCGAGEVPWPDDDDQAAYMEIAEEVLGQAGYRRYEVASYAKPRHACQHNIAYWTGKEYLGLGWSGASMVGRATYERIRALLPQLPQPRLTTQRIRFTCASTIDEIIVAPSMSSLCFDVEELTEREALAEDLMLGSRMSAGLSEELVAMTRTVMGSRLDATLDDLVKRGLLTYNESRYKPTHSGWLLGNELYGALWDLAKE